MLRPRNRTLLPEGRVQRSKRSNALHARRVFQIRSEPALHDQAARCASIWRCTLVLLRLRYDNSRKKCDGSWDGHVQKEPGTLGDPQHAQFLAPTRREVRISEGKAIGTAIKRHVSGVNKCDGIFRQQLPLKLL